MICIRQAVIVEGKYDKIKLSSMLDTLILDTGGFGIFKDHKKMELIRSLAATRGVVIMTDSDAAGFQIRSYLGGSLPKQGVFHAYIPDVYGKEKRKTTYSAERKLGVEGLPPDVLLKALERAGVTAQQVWENRRPITPCDLYNDGLSGTANSVFRRKALLKAWGLPERLSKTALLEVINSLFTYEEYRHRVDSLPERDENR